MYINLQQLEDRLTHLPDEIYQIEKEVLKKEEEFKLEENEFDESFSLALVSAQKNNATEKKHQAIIQTKDIKKEVIKKEFAFKKEEAKLTAKNNEFIALRKVASLEEKLMQVGVSGN